MEILCGQINTFNLKLFHIYNLCGNNKVLQTCQSRLVNSPIDPFTELRLFDWITYTEAWALTSLSHPDFLCYLMSVLSLCKEISNFLLLFIGNLKTTSTWVDWLSIKDCNKSLPNKLASEINLTGLHCLIMDSSLLSDWPTRSWLV